MTYENLSVHILQYLPDADLSLVAKAYAFAEWAHAGQKRASGDDYFVHCAAVAAILADLHLDTPSIAAALLHDVIEDTSIPPSKLAEEFGPEISSMVEGLTTIRPLHFHDRETARADNWRKMLLAVAKDIRIIIIKLADRLHNMRTLQFLPPERRRLIAAESLSLYAPFAHRLGINRIKNELEELAFAELYPREYAEIKAAVNERQKDVFHSLEAWQVTLRSLLARRDIPFRMAARSKTLFGIFHKMIDQNRAFEDIQDIIGLRIITDTQDHCYALLDVIKSNCAPLPDTFTDYIRFPKANMYQSLHITVQDERLGPAEIQIRTKEMHQNAEYGVAAHWRYKQEGSSEGPSSTCRVDEYLDWIRHIREWQDDLTDAREFFAGIETACSFNEIYVFTPRKDVIRLPQGATALDLAYGVHTEIGNHCYGARVEGEMVPPSYRLRSGETCEILTLEDVQPDSQWLEVAVTPRARSGIRRALRSKEEKK